MPETLQPPPRRVPTPRHRQRRSAGLPVAAIVVLLVLATAAWGLAGPPQRPSGTAALAAQDPAVPTTTRPSAGSSPTTRTRYAVPDDELARATALLRRWDRARSAAYAQGDAAALRRLYVGGSGTADVAILRAYAARGLRVHGLRLQLVEVEVLRHRPGEWRLRVVDRLAAGRVVGAGRSVRLPRDRAEAQLVTLVRGRHGRWWVEEVREVRR